MMASGKKSFLLYCDYIYTVSLLSDEQAGRLIKHILQYVNDENPVTDDKILLIAFEPIKQQLKRDLKAWEGEISNKVDGGKMGNLKRWHPDLHQLVTDGKLSLSDAERLLTERKQSDTIAPVAVTVTVNDTVNVKEEKKSAAFRPDFLNLPDSHRDVFEKWWNYKVQIKSKYIGAGWDAFVRLVKKDYPDPIEFADAVEYTMSNNWKGLRKNETAKRSISGTQEPKTRFNRYNPESGQ